MEVPDHHQDRTHDGRAHAQQYAPVGKIDEVFAKLAPFHGDHDRVDDHAGKEDGQRQPVQQEEY